MYLQGHPLNKFHFIGNELMILIIFIHHRHGSDDKKRQQGNT